MTLDPVHVDGIARLASRVGAGVADTDREALAATAWEEYLDPLFASPEDDRPVLEPLADHRRRAVSIPDVALTEPPFPTHHGLDAGTINPTTFQNGLVLDVSQAAMAAVPSDIELHRGRTIVMTVHTQDRTLEFDDAEWRLDDRGYARRRLIHAPRVDRFEQAVVHALALYLAESTHALESADVVEDLLVLDGPIYPTGLLTWAERDPELQRLLTEAAQPRDVVANYLELVETFVQRDVPLIGFVKHSGSRAITRTLRDRIGAPWVDDDAFFRSVLSRPDHANDTLTCTTWFRSRAGTDGLVADESLGLAHDRTLSAADYEVTYFVIYDPRDDLIYRVEAPYAFTADSECRERITTQVLSAVAAQRGPPTAVGKADSLASIDRTGKETLRERIERAFETERRPTYNERRWGPAATAEW